MRVKERRAWAERVLAGLGPCLDGVDTVVFFAGQRYRDFLEPELRERGLAVHVPLRGLRYGEQLARRLSSWLTVFADTQRFYDRLEGRFGGRRVLADCIGGMNWRNRGIYFFCEAGEARSRSGAGLQVVRVGTHGLKAGSRSTLWKRLAQHRGTARDSGGNHRGSIFRLLIGIALAQQQGIDSAAILGRRRRSRRGRRCGLVGIA